MSAMVFAILSTLGTLFRTQLSLRVENVALRHQPGDLPANRRATEYSTRRPHPLVLALAALGKVAGSAGFRSA